MGQGRPGFRARAGLCLKHALRLPVPAAPVTCVSTALSHSRPLTHSFPSPSLLRAFDRRTHQRSDKWTDGRVWLWCGQVGFLVTSTLAWSIVCLHSHLSLGRFIVLLVKDLLGHWLAMGLVLSGALTSLANRHMIVTHTHSVAQVCPLFPSPPYILPRLGRKLLHLSPSLILYSHSHSLRCTHGHTWLHMAMHGGCMGGAYLS